MLNWGVIGAGTIARVFCNGMRFSRTGRIAAVASRSRERANAFADPFAIAKRFDRYEALLADDEIDAVYISTIHPAHAEWAIKAAEAGKHLLVEKPIGMNHLEAAAMIDAAAAHDVFLMEAFMYRCHPQTQRLAELVREGAIGEVRLIRAVFSYQGRFAPESRTFGNALGGGGILDIGCYTASAARLIAGAAAGEPFLEPHLVKGCAQLGPTGVDHYAAATLQFDNGIIAELITGVECRVPSQLAVYGSDGILEVPEPWTPCSPCRHAAEPLPPDTTFPPGRILLTRAGDSEPETIAVEVDRDLFNLRGGYRGRAPGGPPGAGDELAGHHRQHEAARPLARGGGAGLRAGAALPLGHPRQPPVARARRARRARRRGYAIRHSARAGQAGCPPGAGRRPQHHHPLHRGAVRPVLRAGRQLLRHLARLPGRRLRTQPWAPGSAAAACATRWWCSRRAAIHRTEHRRALRASCWRAWTGSAWTASTCG